MVKKLMYLCLCFFYKVPYTCQISISVKMKNVYCEGLNTIRENTVISNSKIGLASGISKNSIVKNTKIGKYTALAPNLKVVSGQHPTNTHVSIHPSFYSMRKQYGFTYAKEQLFEEFRYADYKNKYSVIIGNDVWIGDSVKIMEGVTIGDGAIIATGAVVVKDVEPYSIVGGIPAKLIKYRFSEDDIRFLLELKWLDKGEDWIKKHSEYFCDISVI